MNTIHKYGLIILRDKRFLVNRKKNTSLFLLPGGKPTPHETPEECLVREIKEEHDCDVVTSSLSFLCHVEDAAANEANTIVAIEVYIGEIVGEPKPSCEIQDQRWFGRDDNVTILSPIIKNKILPELIRRELV
ncbi:NUDIX domain-containing protein [Candidatus Woesearchaeota archaeon]|nr:NUDIX domain-containing protein [Candidatus Woesearchaeota archaeon]